MPTITLSASVGRNGVNRRADVVKVKTRLIELGFDWLTPDESTGPLTIFTIRLFQGIKNGLQTVDLPQNDGRVDPGGTTLGWMNAENAPRWIRMPAGSAAEGYRNAEIADPNDNHDFGVNWLAGTIAAAGAMYKATHLTANPSAALLTVNDASVPRGGPTPDHATHQTGLCCDLLLPKRNGAAGGIRFTAAQYDREAARQQILALRAQPLTQRVLFNDPVLITERLCIEVSGHDDHIHVDVQPPARSNAMESLRAVSRRRPG